LLSPHDVNNFSESKSEKEANFGGFFYPPIAATGQWGFLVSHSDSFAKLVITQGPIEKTQKREKEKI